MLPDAIQVTQLENGESQVAQPLELEEHNPLQPFIRIVKIKIRGSIFIPRHI